MTAGQNEKDPSARDEQEAEASSDWEDAFQAEDYLIPTETAPQKTLLDESSGSDAQDEFEPLAMPEEEGAAIPAPKVKRKIPAIRFGAFLEFLGENRFLCSWVSNLPSPLQKWPLFRSARLRGAAVALAVLLCCSFLLLLSFSAEQKKTGAGEQSVSAVERNNPESKKVEPVSPPSLPASVSSAGTASAPSVFSSATDEQGLTEDGTARRKWRFSSFMINAVQDNGATPSYVVVDLSLVLRLQEGEEFPEGKEYAIREMIYQFFSNRPLYELRRFSMARGEMKQKLQAWFEKEWPDNPIVSIFFHRYQII